MILKILQVGILNFTANGKNIYWRNVEGIGYQYLNPSSNLWEGLNISESLLQGIIFQIDERDLESIKLLKEGKTITYHQRDGYAKGK